MASRIQCIRSNLSPHEESCAWTARADGGRRNRRVNSLRAMLSALFLEKEVKWKEKMRILRLAFG
jgi:hypothetical protein